MRRYWLGIGLALVLGCLSGYGLSFLQPVEYQASADVYLEDPAASRLFGAQSSGDSERYVLKEAAIAQTAPVAEIAVNRLGGRLPLGDLRESYVVEASQNQDQFTIVATDSTAGGATEFANAVAAAYQEQSGRERIRDRDDAVVALRGQTAPLEERLAELDDPDGATAPERAGERDVLLQQVADIQRQITELQLDAGSLGDGVRLVDLAVVPEEPSQPQPLRTAAVAGLLTLGVACGLAYWRNGISQKANSRHDPARVLRAPLLGEVPDFASVGVTSDVPAASEPHSAAGEAYQFIVSTLASLLPETGTTSVLVTSASPGDGKSVTALNLAVAASKDERRVVLVDADARMRGLTQLCGVELQCGLTNLRSDSVPVDWAMARTEPGPGVHLSLVPVGDGVADYAGFFRTPGFRKAMTRVKQSADLLVVDSPPILAVAETSAIAGQVDGIVLVVTRGTRMRVLEEMARSLQFVGTPVLGYVFNRGTERGVFYNGVYGMYGDSLTNSESLPPVELAGVSGNGAKGQSKAAGSGAGASTASRSAGK